MSWCSCRCCAIPRGEASGAGRKVVFNRGIRDRSAVLTCDVIDTMHNYVPVWMAKQTIRKALPPYHRMVGIQLLGVCVRPRYTCSLTPCMSLCCANFPTRCQPTAVAFTPSPFPPPLPCQTPRYTHPPTASSRTRSVFPFPSPLLSCQTSEPAPILVRQIPRFNTPPLPSPPPATASSKPRFFVPCLIRDDGIDIGISIDMAALPTTRGYSQRHLQVQHAGSAGGVRLGPGRSVPLVWKHQRERKYR